MGAGTCLRFFRSQSGSDTGSSEGDSRENSGSKRRGGETDELNVILKWYSTLDHKRQLCWVFDKRPSQLEKFIWEVTWEDVRISTDLKLGEVCATTGELNKALVDVVNSTLEAFFGTGEGSNQSNVNTVHTAEEFRKAFNELVN